MLQISELLVIFSIMDSLDSPLESALSYCGLQFSVNCNYCSSYSSLPILYLVQDNGWDISANAEETRAQNAFLAYQAFIIDPVENNPNNTNYITTLAGNNFTHDVFQQQRGYINKYTFNFGAQYTESLFIGVNLNSHEISYFESTML